MDFVFDAAGAQDGINAGLVSLRPRGVFLNVAGWEKNPTIDLNLVTIREITITGKYSILLISSAYSTSCGELTLISCQSDGMLQWNTP